MYIFWWEAKLLHGILLYTHGLWSCMHTGLLFKLRHNGIKSLLIDWISNHLIHCTQKVILNSSFSDVGEVSAGVPNGSILGPLYLLSLTGLFADKRSLQLIIYKTLKVHWIKIFSFWGKNVVFDGTAKEFVESHKHPGISLPNGQWHKYIENVLKSGYKVLGMVRKLKISFSRQA